MWQSVPCFWHHYIWKSFDIWSFFALVTLIRSLFRVLYLWKSREKIAFIEEVGRRQAIYTFEDLDVIFLAFYLVQSLNFFFKSICFAWFFFSTTNHFSRPVCPPINTWLYISCWKWNWQHFLWKFQVWGYPRFQELLLKQQCCIITTALGWKDPIRTLPQIAKCFSHCKVPWYHEGRTITGFPWKTVSQKETTLLNLTPVRWEWFLEL